MKVKEIDHVVIMVKDLEETGKFFADLFETEFTDPRLPDDGDLAEIRSPMGIDLVSPVSEDRPIARTLQARGEGLWSLMLTVENFEEAVEEMKSRGIRKIGGIGTTIALFHPKDLHGVMIGLMKQ